MISFLRPVTACLCMTGWLVSPSVWGGAKAAPKATMQQVIMEAADDGKFEKLFTKAMTTLKAGGFEEARLLFERAAETASIRTSPMSWLTAEFNACHALCLQGRKNEAEIQARRIASRCEMDLGNEDPLTSEALGYLAFVLKQHGHLQDAEPVYRHNVQVLQAKYGPEHPLVATALTKHASLLQTLGKLREAESMQRQALGVMQKVGDPGAATICVFLTNLAFCLHEEQKNGEASELMEKAYRMVEETPDADLTSAGQILRKQAEYYRDCHQLDRAEALARRALLRLARRPNINRARFYYYDLVADVYRSILTVRGLAGAEIDEKVRSLEKQAATVPVTASSSH